ncbi:MAG: hypothetical protein QOE44_2108, partial [Solirubrobacteraceae bacterium]|nr:hypothetical protein [Solirubrobacteraceae bacterium]
TATGPERLSYPGGTLRVEEKVGGR